MLIFYFDTCYIASNQDSRDPVTFDFLIFQSREKLNSIPFARPQDLNSSSAIVTKLTRIQDYILKKFDVELHGHLERLEIAPQIYGM